MFWALAALVLSVGMLFATVWWLWRGRSAADPDLERPPPPQGFANLIDAEYDFVELEIWEEMLDAAGDLEEEKRGRGEEERRADGPG